MIEPPPLPRPTATESESDPDTCKCPKCAPRQWLVDDLVREIRERDNALDELVMSAELAVLYRDARALERLRQSLAGWREASGDPR